MSRPCSHCNKMGHHVRNCSALVEKNRHNAIKYARTTAEPKKTQIVSKKQTSYNSKNTFANLYDSSDDELKEGEIAKSPLNSDTDSSNSTENWNRSGMKNAFVQPVMENYNSKFYEEKEYIYEPCNITLKYKGWSWVDIEYDTDSK